MSQCQFPNCTHMLYGKNLRKKYCDEHRIEVDRQIRDRNYANNTKYVITAVHKTKREILVEYPGVAAQDHVSKAWIEKYIKELPVGSIIIVGGKRYEIEEINV